MFRSRLHLRALEGRACEHRGLFGGTRGRLLDPFFRKSEIVCFLDRFSTKRKGRKARGNSKQEGIFARTKYWYFLAETIRLFPCDSKQVLAARKTTARASQRARQTDPKNNSYWSTKGGFLYTKMCKNPENCSYGANCRYAHTEEELRNPVTIDPKKRAKGVRNIHLGRAEWIGRYFNCVSGCYFTSCAHHFKSSRGMISPQNIF